MSHADTIRAYIEASPPERARNELTAAANNCPLPAVEASEALDALVAENQRIEDYADSLFGELEAERHNHRKDNAYLLAETQRLRDALEDILSTVENANVPYERLQVGALARAALDGTPSAAQTLEETSATERAEES